MDRERSLREQGIEAWWGDRVLQVGLDHDIYDSVGRLYRAFRAVLLKLSEEQFQRFWLLNPQVICLRSLGKVIEVFEGLVIYLRPSVLRMSDDNLANAVAHEVAHVVRHEEPYLGNAENEKATDDLVEQWGFKRAYTRGALQRIRRGE